jgi:hypothetical protein
MWYCAMSNAAPGLWHVAQLSRPPIVVMISAWASDESLSWHAVHTAVVGGVNDSTLVLASQ